MRKDTLHLKKIMTLFRQPVAYIVGNTTDIFVQLTTIGTHGKNAIDERLIMPLIDRNSPEPYYLQVYNQISHGIENGVYPAGKKLPSIRKCARELDVSNTTIELAYQKLTEEGYVQAKRGSGYTICDIGSSLTNPASRFSPEYRTALHELERNQTAHEDSLDIAYDFAYDTIDPTVFPLTSWARISREVFFAQGAKRACHYNDRQGLAKFRKQIAQYVSGEFGLSCSPEQVLVMPTTRDLVYSIASLFEANETVVAIEDPGYDEVANMLSSRGFSITTIPVFPAPKWEAIERAIEGARIVFTTPGCQFPTNAVMPDEIKRKLVSWAQENNAYLIDDEYGWEFQSGIARSPLLAALDQSGRVITIGTFSNSFSPAISLSYAILPPQLMIEWRENARDSHPQVPWQTQAAMAMFMEEDMWRAHIRKARTTMARKRTALVDAIGACFGDSVDMLVGPSSLFVLVRLHDGRGEEKLLETAEQVGVQVYPTNRYWRAAKPHDWRYILIGYASIAEKAIAPGIQALAQAWGIDQPTR